VSFQANVAVASRSSGASERKGSSRPALREFLAHADDASLCEGFRYYVYNVLRDSSVQWPCS
jgi:hypothetical protein